MAGHQGRASVVGKRQSNRRAYRSTGHLQHCTQARRRRRRPYRRPATASITTPSELWSCSSLPDQSRVHHQHRRTVSSPRSRWAFGPVCAQPIALRRNADPGEWGAGGRGAAASDAARSGCSWKCRRQDPSLGFHGRIRWLLNDSCEWARRTGPGRWAHLVSSPGETSACMVTP
jgi:hypothetical protein